MVYGLSWCDIEGRIPEAGCASESCAESLRPAVRERRLSQNERADRPSSGITLETFETSDRERDGGRDRDRARSLARPKS